MLNIFFLNSSRKKIKTINTNKIAQSVQPMPVPDQVMIINAGVEGVLDDLPVDRVREFERDLLKYMNEQRPEIVKAIAATLDLPDEQRKALTAATSEFKAEWREEKAVPVAAK